MYIQSPPPHQQCSSCGVIDYSDVFNRSILNGQQTIRKCRKCGHEKVVSETTWASGTNAITNYSLPPQPVLETF